MEHGEFLKKMLWDIEDAAFAVRINYWFRQIGIYKIADLVRHTEEDLIRKLPRPGAIHWIKSELAEHNLTLGMDVSARIKEIKEACNSIEKIIKPKRLIEYVISTIIGGAIGDALGVPFENQKRDTFKATNMIGYNGVHNQPIGTWSDDTSLTLCLMENIVEGGDCDALMRKFCDWHKNGYMTPHGKCFDDGHTTFAAIKAFGKGTPASQCGQAGEDDNGNGSLMRIAPVAFLNIDNNDFYSRLENVEKYSSITHAHPRSVLGCIIYTEFLRELYITNDKYLALDAIRNICKYGLDANAKYKTELSHYNRILTSDFEKLGRDDIKSDGYVVHTLEAALWCFLRNDNFKDTVLEAVNLGGDTDTTAMVAGSMAGLFDGESIPDEWCNSLAKFDDIKRLCQRYATKLTQGTFTDQRDGKTYKTVKIGDMIWFAENFNYEGEGKYDFETAKKICPEGWHLPTEDEWNLMTLYASSYADDGLESSGKYLKAKEGWKDYDGESGNGEDLFGFAALPGGSFWWSATKCDDENLVWTFSMSDYSDEVQRGNTWVGDKLSVRYVKD